MLDVPAHKTGAPFTKPVDRLVGEAINAWEAVRPDHPPLIDYKPGNPLISFSYTEAVGSASGTSTVT